MKIAASFKIKSDYSVVGDDLVLRVVHPRGLYKARIQNVPRSVYTVPFLLSLHLYFDAPDLDQANDIALDHLADCLNMLAFSTGAAVAHHATKSIVDVDGEPTDGMRDVRLWGDVIEYEDPQPFIEEDISVSIERLLEFELPPALRRAMRWYRLGINETVPDDQFMYFWFALEIVAEFQKSPEEVPTECQTCHTPLYCETCQTHPTHRPFATQAIRDLLKTVDSECEEETIGQLIRARHRLMHGKTLKEIEASLPEPHEEIVDVLGRLVWRSLMWQFPHEMFDGAMRLGTPSTYIKRTLNPVAILRMVPQKMPDGDLDLDFKGTSVTLEPFGPPQSARPKILKLTTKQHERLTQLAFKSGDQQEMCRRIYDQTKPLVDGVLCRVLSTDWGTIQEAVSGGEAGEWQVLFREIMDGMKTNAPGA